ncbi:MAG: hypothetical protein J07HX64_02061 [halophilic archaeon J07HX64]|jgi:hypothetical protein|nr:MAG: hypothetical protein J07HX64_02061 [halophilic archaeon J07HX64]
MSPRGRRRAIATGLLVLGILSLVGPALVPIGSEDTHDTRPDSFADRAELEERGTPIISYESLSDRGQEIYREALLAGGVYSVPTGQGIPALSYPDDSSRLVAIERPVDADLPPADEPRVGPTDNRQHVQRYEVMELNSGPPPLDSLSQLLRFVVGLIAVLSLGVGGYLSTLPAGRPRDSG